MPDLTYTQLLRDVTAMEKDIVRAGEKIQARAQEIAEIAENTARTADGITAMGVDTATVAETRDLASILRGTSDAVIAYASAGETTAKAAAAVAAQARTTHAGIKEQFDRAPVDLSGVKSEWLTQE